MMPNRRMASMTNVVMTGRRMKMAAMFMVGYPRTLVGSQRLLHIHLTLRRQPDLAVGDDSVAGIDAFANDGLIVELKDHGDRPHLDAVAGVDDVDVLPLLPVLDGLDRDHGGVGPVGQGHGHVDELAGPE